MRLSKISIIVIVLAIAMTSYFWIAFNNIHGEITSSSGATIDLPDTNTSDSLFGGILSDPYFNNRLPYYQYKKFEEVYSRIKVDADVVNRGGFGSSWSIGCIGVHSIQSNIYGVPDSNKIGVRGRKSLRAMDSLANLILSETDNNRKIVLSAQLDRIVLEFNRFSFDQMGNRGTAGKESKLFYFSINGYQVKDFNTKFFMDNDTGYLAVVKWDEAGHKLGHYERKKLTVRYSENTKSILIPVSEKTYNKLYIAFQVLVILCLLAGIYIFIGLPLEVLINISKGRAFNFTNIRCLKIITMASAIVTAISLFTPYFLRFIFRNSIPAEISAEPFTGMLLNNLPMIVFTFAAFFITRAFKRGNKLQEEQALTI